MSTRARTPENFPAMKNRAAGRHKRRADLEKTEAVMSGFSSFAAQVTQGFQLLTDTFLAAFGHSPVKADYALAGEAK
jgi:hypothetical protein